eukprot:48048-Eustigmatos_ZCMA.PRE.1
MEFRMKLRKVNHAQALAYREGQFTASRIAPALSNSALLIDLTRKEERRMMSTCGVLRAHPS